ncbi:MAG: hypothetical protein JW894_10485 [Bacteroidales bacterium]|nr:hypothetical protein [Bacteroidales bacterium]
MKLKDITFFLLIITGIKIGFDVFFPLVVLWNMELGRKYFTLYTES